MQSIEISINGTAARVPDAITIEAALVQSGYALAHAAVALNETFVARSECAQQRLQQGDRLEVLMPFSGG